MIQAHADAILALLRAVPTLTVYPEPNSPQQVPTGAEPPYVSVHITVNRALAPTLDMASSRAVVRAYCHCVGGDAIAARAVAQMVSAALLDVVPTIPGRRAYPIRDDGAGTPPRADESTGQLVLDQIDIYRLETLPG